MKVSVDQDACLGCAVCVDVCPDVFETNADGKAEAKVDVVPPELEQDCRDAAEQCPESAIKIEE